ncbi:MAG: spermidine/putrescine ABC transporter substrate-binding protein, partial [Oscillospiraceae bacterium]
MKKCITLLLAVVLAASSLAACAPAAPAKGGSLNLYTWENMFPQEVLDGFTAETGIKVNYSAFDTDETMLSKLQTAKGGDYDLVVADDYIVETAISEGLAQKLDTGKIANYK